MKIKKDEKLSIAFNSYLPLRVELKEFAGLCAERECKTFSDYFEYLTETEGYSLTRSIKKIQSNKYSSLSGFLVLGMHEPKDKVLFDLLIDLSAKSRYNFVRQVAFQELAWMA